MWRERPIDYDHAVLPSANTVSLNLEMRCKTGISWEWKSGRVVAGSSLGREAGAVNGTGSGVEALTGFC